jgi:hypothetical protein
MEPLMDSDAKKEELFHEGDYEPHDPSSETSPHDHEESELLSPAEGADNSKPNAPIQKRRRVTRACDGMIRDQLRDSLTQISNLSRMPAQKD